MKGFKLVLVIMAAAVIALGLSGVSYAFHDGGVAYCEGCHTMHNSSGNKAMAKSGSTTQFLGNPYLLQGADQSSTCLNCHAKPDTAPTSYHIMTYPVPAAGTAPVEMTPGGDFAYLLKTYTGTTSRGGAYNSKGERHGHNIVAAGFGLSADTTLTSAPGSATLTNGPFDATKLGCPSCHDPHSRARIVDSAGTIQYAEIGKATLPIDGSGSYGALPTATEAVGVYRFLGGKKYRAFSYSSGPEFQNDPPIAVAPSTYNRSESATDTRVAYGKGMSEWCQNCHNDIHNDNTGTGNTALIHPAGNGALLTAAANSPINGGSPTTIAAIYNAYVKTGDLTGTQTSSYSSLIPYEEGSADRAALTLHAVNDGSVKGGPSTGTENVMCLSCHRAHAGGFDAMTRWNNNAVYITLNGAYANKGDGQGDEYSTGKTSAEYQAAMYGRPATLYATFQRSLCNKCHAKD